MHVHAGEASETITLVIANWNPTWRTCSSEYGC